VSCRTPFGQAMADNKNMGERSASGTSEPCAMYLAKLMTMLLLGT